MLTDPSDRFAAGATAPAPLQRLAQLDDVNVEPMPNRSVRGGGCAPDGCAVRGLCLENDDAWIAATGQSFSEIYRSRVLGHTGGMFDWRRRRSRPWLQRGSPNPAESARRSRYCSMPAMRTSKISSASRGSGRKILHSSAFSLRPKGLRSPYQELKQTYHRQTEAARSLRGGWHFRRSGLARGRGH